MSDSQGSGGECPVLTLRFDVEQRPHHSLGALVGVPSSVHQHNRLSAIDAMRASDDAVSERWCRDFRQSEARDVIVELGHSTYVNTHRIGVLLRLWALVKCRAGRVVIVAEESLAEDLLRRVQLHRVFRIVSTMESAIDALRRG